MHALGMISHRVRALAKRSRAGNLQQLLTGGRAVGSAWPAVLGGVEVAARPCSSSGKPFRDK